MRIGINGRFLIAKRTGVQRAAYNLLKTLVRIDKENEYFIFTGESERGKKDWDHDNVTLIASPIKEGENIRNHFWEQFKLPLLAKKHQVDLLHSPANTAPFFFKGASVVHIHDLCFVVNPQWYSYSFRTLYNILIPKIARRAARVITCSNNSRNDLMQFCNLTADRVSLVYWAVDDMFLRNIPGENPSPPSKELPFTDYILYVGSLEPRKNIKLLVEAYELFRKNNPNLNNKLVLIGGESPLFGEVRLKIKNYKDDVIFKGFVDDKMLCEYYRHAAVVAYPSLYEGFGLPPLEAMASGTPVITSATSSLPEVTGDAALMVSPYDANQLADAIQKVITDKTLQATLVQKGYNQARKYNWYRVVRSTLAVYYHVYKSQRDESPQNCLPFDTWNRLLSLEKASLQEV